MLRRILDSPWLYYGLAGVLLVIAVVSVVDIRISSRREGTAEDIAGLRDRDDLNVVFILIDTLRADRLGSYGYDRGTSPIMDKLAETGVRFQNVESQSSWTKTSMASMWTGVFPPTTGVNRFHHAVPDSVRMPAEILRDAGLRTAGVWRNGWVAPNFGFGQGFDDYIQPKSESGAKAIERHRPGQTITGSDEDATELAREFLRNYGDERFFLYVHYMDVHQYAYDQVAADENFGIDHSDAYDAAIHWTDRNVGYLLGTLDRLDLFGETIVVIASDHGEAFFEHGIEGHARDLHREVTEVPLLIYLPFFLEGGLVVDTPVRNVDIWPTILDLMGLEPLGNADGRSLVPLMLAAARGEQAPPPETSYAYLDTNWGQTDKPPHPLIAVRHDGKRVFMRPGQPDWLKAYDTARDHHEQENLADDPPEWVGEMVALGKQLWETPPAFGAAPTVQLDRMREGQLRALGYVIK